MEPKHIKIEIDKVGIQSEECTQQRINNLKKQFQSSNINVMIGAGFSADVVGLLANHERHMAEAIESGIENNIFHAQKDFFEDAILPLSDNTKVRKGETERANFMSLLGNIIQNRHSEILYKIVNVFTTNYDLLLENALEKNKLEYVDGFEGKINPIFSTANYGKIIKRQTSISNMISEVVTFNLYKVHGSLNWRLDGSEIYNCDYLETIDCLGKVKSNVKQFLTVYKNKLAIINPTKEKLNTTVLNVNYYDQLRMFCNELEKINTILVSFGFSFNDEHIKQMTLRALKSNPTLTLIIFSYNENSTAEFKKHFNKFGNVHLISLIEMEDGKEKAINFTLDKVNIILTEIFNGTE